MRRAHVLLTSVLSFSLISAAGLPAVAAAEFSSRASSATSPAQEVAATRRPTPTYTAPAAKPPRSTQPAHRVAELVAERREFSQTFELSDGRREVELSTRPVHYRDGSGRWQPVDTRVVGSDRAGFGHRNGGGKFDASFGDRSDRLVRFEHGGRSIQLGLLGSPRAVKPSASGSSLTFADVFGAADVRYTVESRKLKEDIVLQQAPPQAVFTFDVTLAGLKARSLGDGSIGFYAASDPDTMVLRMPRPFMTDSAADPASPTGTGFSDDVTQSVVQNGGRTQIIVRASDEWLRDAKRTYPVRIDPTIEVVATSTTGGQDAGIISVRPRARTSATACFSTQARSMTSGGVC
ncbi:hypothetical protein EV643_11768 [Kribbella sp. VKM Ac-2527]|uniref:Uncharacterized protein n=1 Tax=Kribbella caucasensis TaxID=2512215 RepID=A0A4R6K9A8_9ACTN|nr:hypothetical protein [Kribbella sp. VKM Ac-2527]TDO44045.1 hypothetical protein EV643_11768 [Kribbella sp. VKM Ac-2527]